MNTILDKNFFSSLSHTFLFKKKNQFFYHNLSNINLSPLAYLEKIKFIFTNHNYHSAKHNKTHTTLIK